LSLLEKFEHLQVKRSVDYLTRSFLSSTNETFFVLLKTNFGADTFQIYFTLIKQVNKLRSYFSSKGETLYKFILWR